MRIVWGGTGVALAAVIATIIASGGSSGCPPYPAFPNAGCTGVPAGTSLVLVRGNLLVRPTDETTLISGRDVEDCIVVQKPGVTIENSRAACINIEYGTPAYNTDNEPATIRDVEIDCGLTEDPIAWSSGISGQNYTATRADIVDCANGFDAGRNVTITDSYIHDVFQSVEHGTHTDGIQAWSGDGLIIEHNTFYAFAEGCRYPDPTGDCNGSAAINIGASTDPPISDVLVRRNLIAGGGYTMYCPQVAVENYLIQENHFSRVYSPNVGEYGTSVYCSGGAGGEVFSGNVIHETGEPVEAL